VFRDVVIEGAGRLCGGWGAFVDVVCADARVTTVWSAILRVQHSSLSTELKNKALHRLATLWMRARAQTFVHFTARLMADISRPEVKTRATVTLALNGGKAGLAALEALRDIG